MRIRKILAATAAAIALTGAPSLGFSQAISADTASKIDAAIAKANGSDFDGAASALQALIDLPDGYLAAYNLGVVRERQGQYDSAEKAYLQALAAKPQFGAALRNLTRLYIGQGRVEKAFTVASKYSSQYEGVLEHRASVIDARLAKGQYEDAEREAKQILRVDEKNLWALLGLAESQYQAKRYELAKAVLKRAEEFHPDVAEIHYKKGLVSLKFDKRGEAEKSFRTALQKRPAYPEARNNLGMLFHQARDHAGAIKEFEAAIAVRPDYKEAYLNLGSALKGAGRAQESEIAYRKALSLDEGYAAAHFNLGVLYLDAEVPGMDTIPRLQKAIEELNEYKRKNKRSSKGDPVDKYIAEAKKKIETEKQRQELMREAPIE